LINRAARERLTNKLLLAIYDKAIPKGKSISSRKGAGLKVVGDNIYSQLTGYISKDMNTVYQNYGLGFSG